MNTFRMARYSAAFVLAACFGAVATPSFAKDTLRTDATTFTTFPATSAQNGQGVYSVEFNDEITGPAGIEVSLRWAIEAGPNTPVSQTTTYPAAVSFSAISDGATPITGVSISGSSCSLAGQSSVCNMTVIFTAPEVLSDSTFKLTVKANTPGGNRGLNSRNVAIEGDLIPREVVKKDTTLEVTPDPQCFALNSGVKPLTALLTEAESATPIAGALIMYKVASSDSGSVSTGSDGISGLDFNTSQLAAGVHDLEVNFSGDDLYNASIDLGKIGIYYNFVGFQPPINPEGNSIFGNGRVVPVKIKLVDANLQPVSTATPQLSLFKLTSSGDLGEVQEVASVSSADTADYMRYVSTDQQYLYNLDMSSLTNGTYKLFVHLNDGSAICGQGPYSVVFTVAKKKG